MTWDGLFIITACTLIVIIATARIFVLRHKAGRKRHGAHNLHKISFRKSRGLTKVQTDGFSIKKHRNMKPLEEEQEHHSDVEKHDNYEQRTELQEEQEQVAKNAKSRKMGLFIHKINRARGANKDAASQDRSF